MERAIILSAEHLTGCLNIIADKESRHLTNCWDWKLHPGLFQRIVEIFGLIEADLFASRLTYQVPRFFSWNQTPRQKQQVLSYKDGISFGDMEIHYGVNRSSTIRSSVPEGQCGFDSSSIENTVMVSNVVGYPYRLPVHSELAWQVHPVPLPFQGDTIQLAAWPISGKATERKNFLSKLQVSSWHHGDPSQTQTTTHSFTSGIAGVIQGIEITFLVL